MTVTYLDVAHAVSMGHICHLLTIRSKECKCWKHSFPGVFHFSQEKSRKHLQGDVTAKAKPYSFWQLQTIYLARSDIWRGPQVKETWLWFFEVVFASRDWDVQRFTLWHWLLPQIGKARNLERAWLTAWNHHCFPHKWKPAMLKICWVVNVEDVSS